MTNYPELLTRLRKKTGPISLQDIEELFQQKQYEISVTEFGAKPLDDYDNREAFQAAIDAADSVGGTLIIPGSLHAYEILSSAGTIEIPAHDDGTVTAGHGSPMDPEPINYQAYSLLVPPHMIIRGHGTRQAIVDGGYTYGNASLSERILFATEAGTFYNGGLQDLQIQNAFMAYAGLGSIWANCRFKGVYLANCAIGLYARVLEQCRFSDVESYGTGAPLLVGGQWCDRDDNYNELGGFADKCTFDGTFRNIYGRIFGTAEAAIDTYFDTYFFKAANNSARKGTPIQAGSVMSSVNTYIGICGISIQVISRYARPSVANSFPSMPSHAWSARQAVRITHMGATFFAGGYLEGVGFQNGQARTGAVGVDWTDPYLGNGVKLPLAFSRLSSTDVVMAQIEAQYVYADEIVTAAATRSPDKTSGSTITTTTTTRNWISKNIFRAGMDVIGGAFTALADTVTTNWMGHAGFRSFGFTNSEFDTGIPIAAGGTGCAVIACISRNTGNGDNTNAAITVIKLPYDNTGTPAIAGTLGTVMVTVGKSASNTLTLTATGAYNHNALLICCRKFF